MARILQLVTELVVGGASLTMLDFAEDLANEHELHIAHGRLYERDNAAIRRARANFPTYEIPSLVRPLSGRDDASAVRAFNSLCRMLEPDLVHSHSSKAGIVGRVGVPTEVGARLHTVHGWGHTPLDDSRRRFALIAAERAAALRTTRLIAVSEEVRDEGLALGIGSRDLYAVIGAPVDMRRPQLDFEAARLRARERLRLPIDAEVIGWIGRFTAQKDLRTLAEVVRRVLLERHNSYVAMIGGGPERGLIEHVLHAEILERRVRLVGERDDVGELYRAFDLLIHTSRWEGHPRVVREALASAVPVVSARVSGTRELATDERLGALVEPGDVPAYVSALSRILDSPNRRAPIDEAALEPLRATADEPYQLMRELYRSVIA